MFWIKLYENFKSDEIEDVEDALLTFIDDGECRVYGNKHLLCFEFYEDMYIDQAIHRLRSKKIDNWFIIELIDFENHIFAYSNEIEDWFTNLWNDLKIKVVDDENIYYDTNGNWIFCHHSESGYLGCSNSNYWNILLIEFGLDHKIQILTKYFFEKMSSIKVEIPTRSHMSLNHLIGKQ